MGILHHTIVSSIGLIPKPLLRRMSARYIAGDSLEDAIARANKLQETGFGTIFDILGEDVESEKDAQAAAALYQEAIEALAERGIRGYVSLKPTQFGLRLGRSVCVENVRKVLDAGRERGIFVRIEMEDHTTTDATLDLFDELRREYEAVGIVLQAYLRRSLADARRLLAGEEASRLNVRLCKGIYVEPHEIAFQHPELIRDSYRIILRELLGKGAFVGVATHDERVAYTSLEVLDQLGLQNDAFEFQMLLGVMESLRDVLVAEGHPLRVYVPYGPEWRPYSLRRLRANPALVRHMIRNALRLGPR